MLNQTPVYLNFDSSLFIYVLSFSAGKREGKKILKTTIWDRLRVETRLEPY